MKVRMVTTAAGPAGVFYAGETWEIDDTTARQFLAAGAAVVDVSRETLPGGPAPVEDAAVAPPETKMLQRSKRGRK